VTKRKRKVDSDDEEYSDESIIFVSSVEAPKPYEEDLLRRTSSIMQAASLTTSVHTVSMAQQQQISIHKGYLRSYYAQAFKGLQNINSEDCQIISKAYIELIEPKKRVKYPYSGRKVLPSGRFQRPDPNETKPPWWPPTVRHIRPRYLRKDGKEQQLHLFILDRASDYMERMH
jgi:hypothetical protein